LRNSQVIRTGESLAVRSAARFTPGLTEQQAVRAQQSSKKRQTKPIEISHKSLALKKLRSDGFGLLYAKRTQFRVVEAATMKGWRCRKPARRQLLSQPRYAQILTTDSAQLHPSERPGDQRPTTEFTDTHRKENQRPKTRLGLPIFTLATDRASESCVVVVVMHSLRF